MGGLALWLRRFHLKRWGLAAAFLAVGLSLAACYVPNKFKSEIRLGRNGDFSLYYKGQLTWAPLARDFQRGAVKPSEAQAKIDGIKQDLLRDQNFKSVESIGNGSFEVEYERQGHLEPSQQVTFVRRNAIILMLKASPDGLLTINGQTLKPSDAQLATSMGVNVEGEFRIVTDALVKEHNATTIKPFGAYQVYIWTIDNAFSPAPHFVMQREGVWQPKDQGKSQEKK